MVISVEWTQIETPNAIAETILALECLDFQFVLAAPTPDGIWTYVGPGSLPEISQAKMGQFPQFQQTRVSFPQH